MWVKRIKAEVAWASAPLRQSRWRRLVAGMAAAGRRTNALNEKRQPPSFRSPPPPAAKTDAAAPAFHAMRSTSACRTQRLHRPAELCRAVTRLGVLKQTPQKDKPVSNTRSTVKVRAYSPKRGERREESEAQWRLRPRGIQAARLQSI